MTEETPPPADEGKPAWWRPPMATPGNLAHLKHGADSERMIEARAELVRAELLEVAPWLDRREYAPALARWLRAEARALLIHEWIMRVSETAGPGKVAIRLWEQATAADRLAAQLGNVLGLDPLGKAKLQRAAAGAIEAEAGLADVIAAGRQSRLAAEARLAGSVPPEGAELLPALGEGEDGGVTGDGL